MQVLIRKDVSRMAEALRVPAEGCLMEKFGSGRKDAPLTHKSIDVI